MLIISEIHVRFKKFQLCWTQKPEIFPLIKFCEFWWGSDEKSPFCWITLHGMTQWLWNQSTTHAWIFLFQNLYDHPALHDAVRINWSVCQSTGVDLAAYVIGSKSTMSLVQGSPLKLAPYVFIILTAWTFQFVEQLFHFFSKLYKLLL